MRSCLAPAAVRAMSSAVSSPLTISITCWSPSRRNCAGAQTSATRWPRASMPSGRAGGSASATACSRPPSPAPASRIEAGSSCGASVCRRLWKKWSFSTSSAMTARL